MKAIDTIHVAFATDDQFAPHLGAAIASLLSNASKHKRINIYVLQQNLNYSNRRNLVQLEKLHQNTCIDLLKVDSSKFKFLPLISGVHTIETYFRLGLSTLLPKINKLIYLDADVIVMGNINDLWEQEIGDNILLAVEEPKYLNESRLKSLGMKSNSPYFNGGVLLMDLKKMRDFGLEQKVFTYVNKKFKLLKYQDQDILNALFENRWQALPLAFNAYSHLCNKRREDEFIIYTRKDATFAVRNPHIIHFNLYPKPWNLGCIDTRRKHYWEYLEKTNFEVHRTYFKRNLKKALRFKILYYIDRYHLRESKILSIAWAALLWSIKILRGKKTG